MFECKNEKSASLIKKIFECIYVSIINKQISMMIEKDTEWEKETERKREEERERERERERKRDREREKELEGVI